MDNIEKAIEEIEYRKVLKKKSYDRIKLTTEEREWLLTHTLYNDRLGYPYLRDSVEYLGTDEVFRLMITVESIGFYDKIYPAVFTPTKGDYLLYEGKLTDLRGRESFGKKVGMIVFENGREHEMEVHSKSGLVSLKYGCEYFDENHGVRVKYLSNSSYQFAMRREQISANAIRYYCKSPIDDSFDAMVFTVQW